MRKPADFVFPTHACLKVTVAPFFFPGVAFPSLTLSPVLGEKDASLNRGEVTDAEPIWFVQRVVELLEAEAWLDMLLMNF